jgi:hypothetical protein
MVQSIDKNNLGACSAFQDTMVADYFLYGKQAFEDYETKSVDLSGMAKL